MRFSLAPECHSTPKECSCIVSPSVMIVGFTASRKAYSISLLTMTHQGSWRTTPLHIVQQPAVSYLFDARHTSSNRFTDRFNSSAPRFIHGASFLCGLLPTATERGPNV